MDKEEWVAVEQGRVENVYVLLAVIVNRISRGSHAIRKNVPDAGKL